MLRPLVFPADAVLQSSPGRQGDCHGQGAGGQKSHSEGSHHLQISTGMPGMNQRGLTANGLFLLRIKPRMNMTRRSRNPSSADWQSAVSRIGNPPPFRGSDDLPTASRRIQQVANLRYRKRFLAFVSPPGLF